MINFLRNWVIGITVVSIFLAVAQSLMPGGNIKKVGKIVGGLVLILAISKPLIKLDPVKLSVAFTESRMNQSGSISLLELENMTLVKKIIEEQTNAYISDKARELGAECTVETSYSYSESGMAYPVSAVITGDLSREQRKKLSEYLSREFLISEECQIYKGVAGNEIR